MCASPPLLFDSCSILFASMSEADDEEDADEAAAPIAIVESLFVTKHLQDSTTCSRRRRSSNRPVDVDDSTPPIDVDVAGATRKHRRF